MLVFTPTKELEGTQDQVLRWLSDRLRHRLAIEEPSEFILDISLQHDSLLLTESEKGYRIQISACTKTELSRNLDLQNALAHSQYIYGQLKKIGISRKFWDRCCILMKYWR